VLVEPVSQHEFDRGHRLDVARLQAADESLRNTIFRGAGNMDFIVAVITHAQHTRLT
jgi:hypothetical protein